MNLLFSQHICMVNTTSKRMQLCFCIQLSLYTTREQLIVLILDWLDKIFPVLMFIVMNWLAAIKLFLIIRKKIEKRNSMPNIITMTNWNTSRTNDPTLKDTACDQRHTYVNIVYFWKQFAPKPFKPVSNKLIDSAIGAVFVCNEITTDPLNLIY